MNDKNQNDEKPEQDDNKPNRTVENQPDVRMNPNQNPIQEVAGTAGSSSKSAFVRNPRSN